VSPRILALDLSLTATGYAHEGGSGVIRSRQKGWERVHDLRQGVMALARSMDVVVIEGYAFHAQSRALYQIAGLGEIIRYSLWMRHIPYVDVNPMTLKKWSTGKGNCGKDQMIAAAIHRHGFEGSDNNEADSFLLYRMASVHYHGVDKTTKVELEQVRKVEWAVLA